MANKSNGMMRVSKSDRAGVIQEGNYDLAIKSARLFKENVKGKAKKGSYMTVEIVAATDLGREVYEKYRIADIYEDDAIDVRDFRYDALQELMENIFEHPVDEINEENVADLIGKNFNGDIYHQEAGGVIYPHIDPESVKVI